LEEYQDSLSYTGYCSCAKSYTRLYDQFLQVSLVGLGLGFSVCALLYFVS